MAIHQTGSLCFSVSPETQPCTRGVWISQPQLVNGEHIVYVDSEGTEMGDTSQQHKILALVLLLTCNGGVLIHNQPHFANSALSTLAALASVTQVLGGVEGTSWPHLFFLLRDFELEMVIDDQPVSNERFLEYLLSPTGDQHDEDRRVRYSSQLQSNFEIFQILPL